MNTSENQDLNNLPLEELQGIVETEKKGLFEFEKGPDTTRAWLAGLLQGEAYMSTDKRVRSTSDDSSYTPPPAIPFIKLSMVEEDLMNHFGQLVEQNVVTVNRKTRAGKTVYKVSIYKRDKVERLLRAILPYVVGDKNRSRILQLLAVCEEYNAWEAAGGRSKAASRAASAGHRKRKGQKAE